MAPATLRESTRFQWHPVAVVVQPERHASHGVATLTSVRLAVAKAPRGPHGATELRFLGTAERPGQPVVVHEPHTNRYDRPEGRTASGVDPPARSSPTTSPRAAACVASPRVEVAERLKRFTGTNWTQTTVAQAEASISGTRVRQFTTNEFVALARTFDLPVLFFFMPPEERRGFATPDSPPGAWRWEYLLMWSGATATTFR